MKSRTAIPIAAAATLAAPASANVGFKVDTSTCEGNPFTSLDIMITCYGEHQPSCLFGDTAEIDGTVAAASDFDSNYTLSIKACMWGWCPDENVMEAGGLCSDWLTPTDNQTCGEAGMYNFTGAVEVPQADIPDGWSWLVRIVIGIEHDECDTSGYAESSEEAYESTGGGNSGHSSYSMMGALFGTAGGIAYAAKKKLICNDDTIEDDDDREASFVEMVGCTEV